MAAEDFANGQTDLAGSALSDHMQVRIIDSRLLITALLLNKLRTFIA